MDSIFVSFVFAISWICSIPCSIISCISGVAISSSARFNTGSFSVSISSFVVSISSFGSIPFS